MIRSLALPFAALLLAGTVALAHPPGHHRPATPSSAAQPQTQPPAGDFAWPDRLQNAKVLPVDMGAERLRRTMVSFSRALGVRCTYCHVGAEGAPLSQVDFVSDANPHKEIARGMLRMNQQINGQLLPAMIGPPQAGAPARVTCYTCHQGAAIPATAPPAQPPAQAPGRPAPAG
jgi:photosynthetic reaction center cytochrome c subunit